MIDREDRLLDTIYAAAIDPASWHAVLAGLVELVGADSAAFSRLDVLSGAGMSTVLNNGKRSPSEYFDHYGAINPLHIVDDAARYAAEWTPRILIDEEWMDRAALERSEYYNDYLRPLDAAWKVFIRLGLAGREVTTIGLGRAEHRGRFERDDIARMERLHGHLLRAYRLGERFAALHHRAEGLAAAVEQARSAMILIDADGSVGHANGAAERLFAAGIGVAIGDGRLTATDPASARAIDAAIVAACRPEPRQRQGRSFTVRVPGRAVPLTGSILPLDRDDGGQFGAGARALVSLVDPVAEAQAKGEPVTLACGLTAAERRLTTGLLEGLSLRRIADRHAVSINTVRAQLASVFAKTDTHRQADLVKLLATGRRAAS